MEIDSEQLECPICHSQLHGHAVFSDGNDYDTKCIDDWINRGSGRVTSPLTRENMQSEGIVPRSTHAILNARTFVQAHNFSTIWSEKFIKAVVNVISENKNTYSEMIEALINGADVAYRGEYALRLVLFHWHENLELIEFLLMNGSNINRIENIRPPHGYRIRLEFLKLLLKYGLDVSLWDYFFVFGSILQESDDIFFLLLQHIPDPLVRTEFKFRRLWYNNDLPALEKFDISGFSTHFFLENLKKYYLSNFNRNLIRFLLSRVHFGRELLLDFFNFFITHGDVISAKIIYSAGLRFETDEEKKYVLKTITMCGSVYTLDYTFRNFGIDIKTYGFALLDHAMEGHRSLILEYLLYNGVDMNEDNGSFTNKILLAVSHMFLIVITHEAFDSSLIRLETLAEIMNKFEKRIDLIRKNCKIDESLIAQARALAAQENPGRVESRGAVSLEELRLFYIPR
jgi:hypothetical protein